LSLPSYQRKERRRRVERKCSLFSSHRSQEGEDSFGKEEKTKHSSIGERGRGKGKAVLLPSVRLKRGIKERECRIHWYLFKQIEGGKKGGLYTKIPSIREL